MDVYDVKYKTFRIILNHAHPSCKGARTKEKKKLEKKSILKVIEKNLFLLFIM